MRHRTSILIGLVAIILAPLVAACGGASSSPASAGQTLEGRTFLSTRVEGRSLVPGSVIRLTFQNGQISASAGCNSMSGPYRVNAGVLVAGQLAMTEMGCDPPLMAQDTWVADLLNGSAVALDGDTLTLTKAAVRVTFLDRVVADPDRPLLGTRWVVDGIISGSVASSIPAGVTAAITLTDAHVDVETGCNTGSATAVVTDGSITFSDLVLTKKACLNGTAALEDAVTAVLRGTATYAIQADRLTLQSGATGITLRATP